MSLCRQSRNYVSVKPCPYVKEKYECNMIVWTSYGIESGQPSHHIISTSLLPSIQLSLPSLAVPAVPVAPALMVTPICAKLIKLRAATGVTNCDHLNSAVTS